MLHTSLNCRVSCTGSLRSTRSRVYGWYRWRDLFAISRSRRCRAWSSLIGPLISSQTLVSLLTAVTTYCTVCSMARRYTIIPEPPNFSAHFFTFCRKKATQKAHTPLQGPGPGSPPAGGHALSAVFVAVCRATWEQRRRSDEPMCARVHVCARARTSIRPSCTRPLGDILVIILIILVCRGLCRTLCRTLCRGWPSNADAEGVLLCR